ncbi:MAG: hypothetical protein HYR91_05055 [Flavobacteriia bacterium]|nr:hypothetical protein [Flavobacteriia bacterium]
MKKIIFVLFAFLTFSSNAQTENIHLTNALVVGQLDKSDDRYLIEAALTELLTNSGIKATPSINILKVGNDSKILASDSIQNILKAKGFDTYILVSVRGFDKRFKLAKKQGTLLELLSEGHLFPIYRDEAASVSFEFFFYRNGVFVGTDLVKCGNISSKETVIKRFKKKIRKCIIRKWK